MGSNSKIMVGTTSRVWRDKDIGLPAPSSGAFLSDLGFQNTWETQPRAAWRGRDSHRLPGRQSRGDRCQDRARHFHLRADEDVAEDRSKSRPERCHVLVLDTYPFTLGSYASCKVGQYTTMLEEAAVPALHGRLQFAGEQTSGDFIGFMNGGVLKRQSRR